MEEKNIKKQQVKISKSTYLNVQNNTNQMNLDKPSPETRSQSHKNENGEINNKKPEQKLTAIKKIELSPKPISQIYNTDTYNSHINLNSKLNIIDSISEKNNSKIIPISREKKIYLYLKNNNINSNNCDMNSISDTPKRIYKKSDDIIDELILDEGINEKNDNFNKTNIINNVNNNNVNNIFVNFISSNIQNDLSRNLLKNKINNNYNNNRMENNSLLDDGLNKTLEMQNSTKDL